MMAKLMVLLTRPLNNWNDQWPIKQWCCIMSLFITPRIFKILSNTVSVTTVLLSVTTVTPYWKWLWPRLAFLLLNRTVWIRNEMAKKCTFRITWKSQFNGLHLIVKMKDGNYSAKFKFLPPYSHSHPRWWYDLYIFFLVHFIYNYRIVY